MSTPHRRFKDTIYDQLARVGKAVSAPKRLELLDLLAQAPRTVEVLAGQAALSVANASQHLQVLRAAGLVTSRKQGQHVEYRLAGPEVARFGVGLRALARARLAEIDRETEAFVSSRDALEPVDRSELLRRAKAGEVTVLDVRPTEEFEAGHLPGAISIPAGELKSRLRELPKGREVVAYCRGPFCVMSLDAVEQLRAHGYRARRLETDVAEWESEGGRLQAGPGEPAKAPARRGAKR